MGRFRRRHLVPVPNFADIAELNAYMAAADAKDDQRRITGRIETVGAAAARELPELRALPAEAFDPAAVLSCRVDARARICVRQSYYSVPARYAGRRLQVKLGATTVVAVGDGVVVARHVRSIHKYSEDLQLDHYLEVLVRKPGALAGSTALAGARAGGAFTTSHQRFWDAARRDLGDTAGTRALIGVLLLHRTQRGTAGLIAAMDAAVAMGRFDPDLVAVEARRLTQAPTAVPVVLPAGAPPAALGDHRPTPSLAAYDALLAGVGA